MPLQHGKRDHPLSPAAPPPLPLAPCCALQHAFRWFLGWALKSLVFLVAVLPWMLLVPLVDIVMMLVDVISMLPSLQDNRHQYAHSFQNFLLQVGAPSE